jgi:hypothetical protein
VTAAAPEADAVDLDQARASLAGLDDLPVAEHAAAYAEVQRRLQSALTGLDHL